MTLRILLPLTGALILAACSGGPKVQTGAPPAIPTAASDVDAIAALLHRGERKDAKKRLDAALKRDPMNPSLMLLRQGITGNARADLGPVSYPYVVKPGDTMPELAQRFLGNRLKAYQLARYNGIDSPASLKAGAVLNIPGQPQRAPSELRAAPAAPARPRPATAVPAPSAKPAAPTPAANPAAAQRARSVGLAALNRGKVNEAVAQLRRAAALDPGNPAIGRDLARAERIAATVRSRR